KALKRPKSFKLLVVDNGSIAVGRHELGVAAAAAAAVVVTIKQVVLEHGQAQVAGRSDKHARRRRCHTAIANADLSGRSVEIDVEQHHGQKTNFVFDNDTVAALLGQRRGVEDALKDERKEAVKSSL